MDDTEFKLIKEILSNASIVYEDKSQKPPEPAHTNNDNNPPNTPVIPPVKLPNT